MPSTLADLTGRDILFAYLFSFLLDFALLQIVICTAKKETAFSELLKNTVTDIPTRILMFFYFLYFTAKAVFFAAEQKTYIQKSLYQTETGLLEILPFLIFAAYFAMKGLKSVGRIADLTLFSTVFALVSLMELAASSGNYSAFFPALVNGKNIFFAFKASLLWGGDFIYLLFALKNFKYEKGTRWKLSVSYLSGGVLTMLLLTVFYAVFTYIAKDKTFAFAEIAQYNIFLSNTARFDYLSILLLLFSAVIGAALPFYFASTALNAVFRFPFKLIPSVIAPAIALIIFFFFGNDMTPFFGMVLNIYPWFSIVFGYLIPALSPLLKSKRANGIPPEGSKLKNLPTFTAKEQK